jgi:hypothetical protein
VGNPCKQSQAAVRPRFCIHDGPPLFQGAFAVLSPKSPFKIFTPATPTNLTAAPRFLTFSFPSASATSSPSQIFLRGQWRTGASLPTAKPRSSLTLKLQPYPTDNESLSSWLTSLFTNGAFQPPPAATPLLPPQPLSSRLRFGDLVTAQWWSELWLNEGFATCVFSTIQNRFFSVFTAPSSFSYFEYEGMNGFMPDWKIFKDFNYNDRAGALAYDSSLGSHALSNFQPGPWSPGEIGSMFDSISCVGHVLFLVPCAHVLPPPTPPATIKAARCFAWQMHGSPTKSPIPLLPLPTMLFPTPSWMASASISERNSTPHLVSCFSQIRHISHPHQVQTCQLQ